MAVSLVAAFPVISTDGVGFVVQCEELQRTCILDRSSRLSHSNICGALPVGKINVEMKSEEKTATLQK